MTLFVGCTGRVSYIYSTSPLPPAPQLVLLSAWKFLTQVQSNYRGGYTSTLKILVVEKQTLLPPFQIDVMDGVENKKKVLRPLQPLPCCLISFMNWLRIGPAALTPSRGPVE